MRHTQIPGHGLLSEGVAFTERGHLVNPSGGTYGEGCGNCSCGEISPTLMTGQARKRWHQGHKDTVVNDPKGEGLTRP